MTGHLAVQALCMLEDVSPPVIDCLVLAVTRVMLVFVPSLGVGMKHSLQAIQLLMRASSWYQACLLCALTLFQGTRPAAAVAY